MGKFQNILLEQKQIRDRLNGEPLSDTEFEQVKNQLQFSSFYKAGEWLVGEMVKFRFMCREIPSVCIW